MRNTTAIRIVLSLLLVYGVYTETGIWTALSVFLVFANLEVQAYLNQRAVRDASDMMRKAEQDVG